MRVTMWGTRGGVPVSGRQFMRYGGATTCLEVEGGGEGTSQIIIDCGTGLAELGKARRRGWQDALILQTHLHWDHIQGFPFFQPLFAPTTGLTLWSVDRDGRSMEEVLRAQMRAPTFPVTLDRAAARLAFRRLPSDGEARVGAMSLGWAEMCHPSGSTAYRIESSGGEGRASLVFSGDVEVRQSASCRQALVSLARGADLLVMDAQYTEAEYGARRGWGHSTVADAVEVALEAEVGRLVLTHHDPTHDDARLDAKLVEARRVAAGRVLVDNGYDGMVIEVGACGAGGAIVPAAA